MRTLLTNLILLMISATIAYFVVRVFDDWSQDCRETRERRKDHPANGGPRYE